ncbi:hypothetical protein ACP6L2_13375 [Sphingobacterium lactis]|uniref:hypothetical protein n=1 Tax=Sphingobacterium lactis TaxID=797291 RepID=UPI003F80D0F8
MIHKSIKGLFSLLIITTLLISCKKDNLNSDFNFDATLAYGMVPWTYITINDKDIVVYSKQPDNNSKPNKRTFKTTTEELNQIKDLINNLKLMELKVDECDRCRDGVDLIANIRFEGKSNKFSLGGLDPEEKYKPLWHFFRRIELWLQDNYLY